MCECTKEDELKQILKETMTNRYIYIGGIALSIVLEFVL